MIILQITQLKNFMNTLLRLETFDRFPVSEASITTFTTFSIDGSLHTDFFDPDDAQLLKEKGRTRLLWKDVKSFCYSVIKGKRTPLQFKFVFQLPQAACEKMIADHALPLEIENVFGCFLNFQENSYLPPELPSKSLRWTSRSTASSMRKSASFC